MDGLRAILGILKVAFSIWHSFISANSSHQILVISYSDNLKINLSCLWSLIFI